MVSGVALVVGCAGLVLAACGGGDDGDSGREQGPRPQSSAKHGGTLTMLWNDDVDSIDPGITYYNGGYLVVRAAHRPLMAFKPDDVTTPVPDLAAAPPVISPDGRTVTVRLRRGVRFSPPVGREVLAGDVKYGVERGFFNTVNTPYAGVYFGDLVGAEAGAPAGRRIAGIETPDDRTVVFRLSRPTGGVVARALVMPLTAPVPREYALPLDRKSPSAYGQRQVATGPYMVDVYEPGKRIHLVRNPNWRPATDFKPAYLDQIEVREGNDDGVATARRVLRGESLVTGDFPAPPSVVKQALERSRDQLALPSVNGGRWVSLNTKLEPLDDVNVRRAVVAGFDREAMRLTAGGREVADLATHFIPPGTPGFAEAGGRRGPAVDFLKSPAGDLRVAAAHFRKAGHASGRYEGKQTLFMAGIAGGAPQRAAESARQSLERLGFKVRLRLMSFETLITRFCGSPKAKVHVCPNIGWARDFADGQSVLAPTFGGDAIAEQGNTNPSELDDPAINRAIARARLTVDPSERAKAWGAVDRMVTEAAAAVPVSWDRFPLLRSKNVVGVVAESLALWDPTFTSLR